MAGVQAPVFHAWCQRAALTDIYTDFDGHHELGNLKRHTYAHDQDGNRYSQPPRNLKPAYCSFIAMSDPDFVCTLDTCPIEYGYINYQPNVAGNLFFVALYGVLLLAQLALGIFNRTWSFTVALIPGLILEILGYLGRYFLHNNPFSFDNFLLSVSPQSPPI